MAPRLLNKVAVVTGAGGDWGRAIVQEFFAEGAKVVVFDRDRGPLDELAAISPARALVVEGDVTRAADLESLVQTTVRRFGPVDVLLPAAEIWREARLAECTPELVIEILAVNLQAALQTVRVFERHLNRDASVVFLTTPPATAASAGRGPYSGSKAALAAVAQTLAVELSPRGIRVNCVAPTRNDSPTAADGSQRPTQSGEQDTRHSQHVAETVLFLASDNAAGVTGQQLIVDTQRA